MSIVVQGMKVPLEQQYKSVARICKTFGIKINPDWSFDDVKRLFQNKPKELKRPPELHIGMNSPMQASSKAVYIEGLPLCFQQYDVLTLINLFSEFNTSNANFYIDMFEDDEGMLNGECLVRFMSVKFCTKVFRDLQGLSAFDNNIKVHLDLGNEISLSKDYTINNKNRKLNKVVRQLLVKQHEIMAQYGYMEDYSDVEGAFQAVSDNVQSEDCTKSTTTNTKQLHTKLPQTKNIIPQNIINKSESTVGTITHPTKVGKEFEVQTNKPEGHTREFTTGAIIDSIKTEIQPGTVKTELGIDRNISENQSSKAKTGTPIEIKQLDTNGIKEATKTARNKAVIPSREVKAVTAVERDKPAFHTNEVITTAVETVLEDKVDSKKEEKCRVVSIKNLSKCNRLQIISKLIKTNISADMRYRIYEVRVDSKWTGEHLLQFATHEDAVQVCNKLNGVVFKKNRMQVELAVGRVFPLTGTVDNTVTNWCKAQEIIRNSQMSENIRNALEEPELQSCEKNFACKSTKNTLEKPKIQSTEEKPTSNMQTTLHTKPEVQTIKENSTFENERNLLDKSEIQTSQEKPTRNIPNSLTKPDSRSSQEKIEDMQYSSYKPQVRSDEEKVTFKNMLNVKRTTVVQDTNCRVVAITNLPQPKGCHLNVIKQMIDRNVSPNLRFLATKAKPGSQLKMIQSRVYLVQFPSNEDAVNVCNKLDGIKVSDKYVSVTLALGREFPVYGAKRKIVSDESIYRRFLPKKKQRKMDILSASWKADESSICASITTESDNKKKRNAEDSTAASEYFEETVGACKKARKTYRRPITPEESITETSKEIEKSDADSGPSFLPPEVPNNEAYGLSLDFLNKHEISTPLRTNVIVKNLHPEVDVDKLYQVFSMAGVIRDIKEMNSDGDEHTANIEFDHPVEAVQAISLFHGQILFDNKMSVQMDTGWEKRPLPMGLSSVGKGLGKDGAAMRGVRVNIELIDANEELVEAGRMAKHIATDKTIPFQYTYADDKNNINISDVPVDSTNDSDCNGSEENDENYSAKIKKISEILASGGLISAGTECNDLESLLNAIKNKNNDTNRKLYNTNTNCDPRINQAKNSDFIGPNSKIINSQLAQNMIRPNMNTRECNHNEYFDVHNAIQKAASLYDDLAQLNSNIIPNTTNPYTYLNLSNNNKAAPTKRYFNQNMQNSNQDLTYSNNRTFENFKNNTDITMKYAKPSSSEQNLSMTINDSTIEKEIKYSTDKERNSGGGGKNDMLIFKNLPSCLSAEALSSKLREVGGVVYCERTASGRAVVRFASAATADRCRQLFHRSKVNGQVIDVSLAGE